MLSSMSLFSQVGRGVYNAEEGRGSHGPTAQNLEVSKKKEESPQLYIPKKVGKKYGFVNQYGAMVVEPLYDNVGFYTEDCNLLNSSNATVRKYGTKEYATVSSGDAMFRITKEGRKAYVFQQSDLSPCKHQAFRKQLFSAYLSNGLYGIVSEKTRLKVISPEYQYLHILEGEDLQSPMIIAAKNDRFGIIDSQNNVIIPFVYADIKRNYSWKLAKLFEVTKDGQNYFFVDSLGKTY